MITATVRKSYVRGWCRAKPGLVIESTNPYVGKDVVYLDGPAPTDSADAIHINVVLDEVARRINWKNRVDGDVPF